ncbi:carbohydrate kinase family protein [Pseudolysinimonas yzui]|uniref:carbohydrate kinase family protein n=1 Tax=Pseudolysinimonas yzui TaxID=2708254 RepID=UPI00174B7B1F|nr:carbohydrate kinase family protein [Pseudolysinimonas yzui]
MVGAEPVIARRVTGGRVVVVGDLMNDIVVVPRGPILPDTDTESQVRPRPGGSAANTAAWLGSLGAPVDFVGAVGDADAETHAELFREGGVTPHLQVEPGMPTGSIVILVRGEERSMLTERGANAAFSGVTFTDDLLDTAAIVHLSGYTIVKDFGPGAARDILRRVRERGIPFSVTPGSYGYLAQYGAARFLDDIRGAEILIPNLAEGRLLSGEDDPMAVGAALLEHSPIVLLTRGSLGVILFRRDQPPLEVPPPPVAKLVDPTGAGDALAAGFLAHWVRSRDAEAAVRAAVLVAARAVMLIGGRPPL